MMDKIRVKFIVIIMVLGLIILYILDPLNRQPESNGWISFFLIPIVILSEFNLNQKINLFLRIIAVGLYIYLLVQYF